MKRLDKKYVFHIPLYRYENGTLELIDVDDVLDDLIGRLGDGSFDSLYVTKVESHYRSRRFDELLLTLFVEAHQCPEEIFGEWFRQNNGALRQEEFAYECGNTLFIERLDP